MYELKHRDKLLSDIVEGLKRIACADKVHKLRYLEVHFYLADQVLREFSLIHALECISSDLYFDEAGNFSDVDSARLVVI